jgi:glycosyltransferase involved in cell wall biosynthesis
MTIEDQATEVDKVKRSENGVITNPFFLSPRHLAQDAEDLMRKYKISGVPCLAFPKGAIPEIIGPEIDGFLTEEVSAAALTAGINRALELFTKAPHHWHTLCKNARQKAELFSIERTVAQLEALYQEQ